METLETIGLRHGSDKFTRHGFQSYYARFLEPRRMEPLKVLEIGIGGEGVDTGAPSLVTWRDYLPNAEITGIDIFDKSMWDGERINTVVCSQTDVAGLQRLSEQYGPFDVVIDDGSHKGPDVGIALFTLFSLLKPNGIYFLEDIQTSYWPQYSGSSLVPACYDTAVRWLKASVDLINRGEILDPHVFPLTADLRVAELHVFHNLGVLVKASAEHSYESKVVTDEIRPHFLSADVSMHGDIAASYQRLVQDPAMLRTLLRRIEKQGGLDAFLAD